MSQRSHQFIIKNLTYLFKGNHFAIKPILQLCGKTQ